MDWLLRTLETHGGTLLGVLSGAICVIVVIAAADGRRGDRAEKKRDSHREGH
ncbi:MAG TPA: hypothetical protein VFZ65_16165 [Planctomycetota bacterium]|nr:hypothetical protein [Planctomycetota bacterium]